MRKLFSCALLVALLGLAGAANGLDAAKVMVQSLLKDLKGSDYHKARAAAGDLGNFPEFRAQIVPALLDALNQEWDHCTGEIRQAIGVSLAQLAGKDAVFPLLKLLQSGKNVGHDCAECEAVLLEDGSRQEDIRGADWVPSTRQIRFEALINIRPRQKHPAMWILDQSILARGKSFSDHPGRGDVVKSLVEESKFLIEWTTLEAGTDWQAEV